MPTVYNSVVMEVIIQKLWEGLLWELLCVENLLLKAERIICVTRLLHYYIHLTAFFPG